MLECTVAVVREKSKPFTIETMRLEDPRADEVIVRIVGTGVCHTDMIVRDQYYPTPLPAVLGHEGAGVVEEVLCGLFEQRHLDGFCLDEIAGAFMRRKILEAVGGEPAIAHEELKADEQRIACEGGERGVRRIAVASGIQRQDLPHALLASGEKVYKGVSRWSEVAHAADGWQRGYVQQNSGDSFRCHIVPHGLLDAGYR